MIKIAQIKNVILLAVSLMVIAVIMPIAIGLISGAGTAIVNVNGTDTTLAAVADPSVVTLLTVLLPVIAVIGIILGFLPKAKKA